MPKFHHSGGVAQLPQCVTSAPVVLVDMLNLIYRCQHAMRHLATAEGVPTGALYGVLNTMRRLAKLFRTDRLVACWDNGIPGDVRWKPWRVKLFPEYKAGRRGTEQARAVWRQVRTQLPVIHHALWLLGHAQAGIPGLEADDVIAYLAHWFNSEQATHIYGPQQVLIVSTDQDFYQLLSGNTVQVCRPSRTATTGFQLITQRKVETEYGFPLSRWPAYLVLGGDHSDNICHLPGLGPAAARRLVILGADPGKPLAANPKPVRQFLIRKQLAERWPKVQQMYLLARLPQSILQDALTHRGRYLQNISGVNYLSIYPGRAPWQPGQLEAFTCLCAEYELSECLALRREFFRRPNLEASC